MLKFMVVTTLFTLVFISCKKTNENVSPNLETLGSIQAKNGIVEFSDFAIYLKTVENKNEEQQKLQSKLTADNFTSLKSKPFAANPTSFVAGAINSFTNAFNPELYTEYMLSVLNKDKICRIDGFWVKVDMDNNFCNALDATLYPSEYNDLVSNSTENTHIMHFLSQDEPVLDALSGIRNGSLTWDTYQGYVAKKGGQGICFRRGLQQKSHYPPELFRLSASAAYITNFLSFELVATGGNRGPERIALTGDFDWEGVCKGSGSSTNFQAVALASNPTYKRFSIYSGGSALWTAKLRTKTNKFVGTTTVYSRTASIYY